MTHNTAPSVPQQYCSSHSEHTHPDWRSHHESCNDGGLEKESRGELRKFYSVKWESKAPTGTLLFLFVSHLNSSTGKFFPK